jgi:hypothetical protein
MNMTTMIDFGYAANLGELQDVIENLTGAAAAEHEALNKDKHFDPEIVQLGGMQVRVTLESKALEDGSFVFDLRFAFMSESEMKALRSH